jgi:hypothetical protein
MSKPGIDHEGHEDHEAPIVIDHEGHEDHEVPISSTMKDMKIMKS